MEHFKCLVVFMKNGIDRIQCSIRIRPVFLTYVESNKISQLIESGLVYDFFIPALYILGSLRHDFNPNLPNKPSHNSVIREVRIITLAKNRYSSFSA